MPPISDDCWFLTGTTASGKTTVGIVLAQRLGADILSMDSMTIYQGMDIGTAKPTAEQQAAVPHHLIDVVPPTALFSLHDYLRQAHAWVERLREQGRQALFVGGTPLYLKGLLRGVFEGPPADPEFRKLVEQELQQTGPEALHRRLELVDPVSASRLHPHNTRRIIRALEVYRLTGQPISHLQLQFERRSIRHRRVVALWWSRAELAHRIQRRVEQMFDRGLVEEVQGLIDKYDTLSRTASQAVGYREVLAMLRGEYDREEALRQTILRTRQLARRQETWLRHLPEVRRLPMRDESPEGTAERVLKLLDHVPPTGGELS